MQKHQNKKLVIGILLCTLMVAMVLTGCSFSFTPTDQTPVNSYVVMTNTAQEDTTTQDLEAVIAAIQPKVVEIYCTVSGGRSAGSGVIIGKKNNAEGVQIGSILVTNHHVIEGGTSISIKLSTGESYAATLVGSDPQGDIAVLSASFTGIEPAVWVADSSTVKVGSTAIVVGNALGTLGGTVTKGIISAVTRTISVDGKVMEVMQTDAAINGGNSGGGLFNARGNLVGIVNAKAEKLGVEGLGFAIPANAARDSATQLLSTAGVGGNTYGYVAGRYSLGVTFGYFKDFFGQIQGIGVNAIDPKGQGYLAGMRVNDMITSVTVNGVRETSIDKMLALLLNTKYPLGQEISLTVHATNNTQTEERNVKIVLEQYIYIP